MITLRKLAIIVILSLLPSLCHAQGGNKEGTLFRAGMGLGGVNVSICQPLATTAANISGNLASLTMSSNPATAGFVAGGTILVAGFTGGDTYFNGGSYSSSSNSITSGYTILSVTSTQIIYSLVHANASAGTNGTVLQMGNSTTSCGGLSALYTDNTLVTPASNPLVTDGYGNFQVWAAPGPYYYQTYGASVTTQMRLFSVACVPSASTTTCGALLGSNNAFTGNNSHVGTETFANINNVIYVDGVKYTTIPAAIAALPAAGGHVVVPTGTYVLTSTLTLGSASQNVYLDFTGRVVDIQCNITSGAACIDIWGGSGISCPTIGNNNCIVETYGAGTNVSALVQSDPTAVQETVTIRGLALRGNNGGTVTALFNGSSLYDSNIYDLSINSGTVSNAIDVYMSDASASICPNNVNFYGLLVNGSYQTGARPIVAKNTAGCAFGPISFFGGDIGHPSTANYDVEINGNGHAYGIGPILFEGTYFEDYNANQATPAMVLVEDAFGVKFDHILAHRSNASATEYFLNIADTTSTTGGVDINHGLISGGTGHSFVTNTIVSQNYTNNAGGTYTYSSNGVANGSDVMGNEWQTSPLYSGFSSNVGAWMTSGGGPNFPIHIWHPNGTASGIKIEQDAWAAWRIGLAASSSTLCFGSNDAMSTCPASLDTSGNFTATASMNVQNSGPTAYSHLTSLATVARNQALPDIAGTVAFGGSAACAYQGALSPVVGTGSAVTYYTCTIPGKVIAAGKGIRVVVVSKHTTGTANVAYTLTFGGTTTTVTQPTGSSNQLNRITYEIFNGPGVTNAQNMFSENADSASGTGSLKLDTAAIDTTANVTINAQMNVANTDQITPEMFWVEMIQ